MGRPTILFCVSTTAAFGSTSCVLESEWETMEVQDCWSVEHGREAPFKLLLEIPSGLSRSVSFWISRLIRSA